MGKHIAIIEHIICEWFDGFDCFSIANNRRTKSTGSRACVRPGCPGCLESKEKFMVAKVPRFAVNPDLWLHATGVCKWTLNDYKLIPQAKGSKVVTPWFCLMSLHVLQSCTFSWWFFVLYSMLKVVYLCIYLCLVTVCRFVLPGWVVEEGSNSERLQGAGKFGKANWPNNIQSIQSCPVKNFPNLTHENAHDPCSWATGRYDRNGGRMTTRTKFGGSVWVGW